MYVMSKVEILNLIANKDRSDAKGKFQATNVTCYNCGKPGHRKADCPDLVKGFVKVPPTMLVLLTPTTTNMASNKIGNSLHHHRVNQHRNGKQTRRPAPGRNISTVTDKAGALKVNDLMPGQRISVDHFVCSSKGRLQSSRGKTNDDELYTGGCIFVDHASSYVHVVMQRHLNTHETINAKTEFEQMCLDNGVVAQGYQSDNGSSFTSAEYTTHLKDFQQVTRFAGVGAHHHNGVAERAIQHVMAMARTMMLHSALHWPEVADAALWPLAVSQACFIINHVPNEVTGLAPCDIVTKMRWEQRKLHDIHVWGCPVYVLDKHIGNGKKIPRLSPRSTRYMYMGMSQKHATTVPMVLNLQTGTITPQYHVIFDDWFATVATYATKAIDFTTPTWSTLFGDSTFPFHSDDDLADNNADAVEPIPTFQHNRATQAIKQPDPLPVDLPPEQQQLDTSTSSTKSTPGGRTAVPRQTVMSEDTSPLMKEPSPDVREPSPVMRETASPSPEQELPIVDSTLPRIDLPLASNSTPPLQQPTPTRPQRNIRPTSRYGNDGSQTHGYMDPTEVEAYRTVMVDPDTLTFDQAMKDAENMSKWWECMEAEIKQLSTKNTWLEVPLSQAKTKVLPGTSATQTKS